MEDKQSPGWTTAHDSSTKFSSIRWSKSFSRALGLIAICLVNFALIYAMLASMVYPEMRTGGWGFYRWQFQSTVVTAMFLGPLLILAGWAVFAKQRWMIRAAVCILGLIVWLLSAWSGMWGPFVGEETTLGVFWLALILLIPSRAGLGLSIVWAEQPVNPRPSGQFRIAEILGWMAAIAGMLTYFRQFAFGYSSQTVMRVVYEAVVTFATAALIAGPLLWIVIENRNRSRRFLQLLACISVVCCVIAAGYVAFAYVTRFAWWGFPLLEALRLYLFWLVLAASLIANGWALERLGLRWCCQRAIPPQSRQVPSH